jgi:hypothetical protein
MSYEDIRARIKPLWSVEIDRVDIGIVVEYAWGEWP